MLSFKVLFLAAICLASTATAIGGSRKALDRQGKVFSLFNIVKFKNTGCRSTSTFGGSGGFRNGTCFTQSECNEKGGSASGTCSAGFGVCCIFSTSASGSEITQNCSYIQNPGYPGTLSSSDTAQVSYTIRKCSDDICSIRLDFESFTLLGPTDSLENTGHDCRDEFQVTATNAEQRIPVICGQNTGQHMYVEVGRGNSDIVNLRFQPSSTDTSTSRQWDIKVSQIPCGSNYRQPEGCLQYYTGLTGRFTTFNFIPEDESHLSSQEYGACIRQEAGFCCVRYSVCQDQNSFTIDNTLTAKQDSKCTGDYIGIASSSYECSNQNAGDLGNRYCGKHLQTAQIALTYDVPVCDCTPPFQIDVYTNAVSDVGATIDNGDGDLSRGVCLEWMQVPCQSA